MCFTCPVFDREEDGYKAKCESLEKEGNGHCTQTRRLIIMATNFLVGVAIKPVDCWSTKKYKSTTRQLVTLAFSAMILVQ